MDDSQVHGKIEQLVAEEHELWDREAAGNGTESDRQRLRELKVALDQCWDRRRRQRRPERRLRHAHLLHQRPTPLRRLRHRHPLGGCTRSGSAGNAGAGVTGEFFVETALAPAAAAAVLAGLEVELRPFSPSREPPPGGGDPLEHRLVAARCRVRGDDRAERRPCRRVDDRLPDRALALARQRVSVLAPARVLLRATRAARPRDRLSASLVRSCFAPWRSAAGWR